MNVDQQDLTAKEKIRYTAFIMFGKSGFSGTSIRQIAHESGVSLGLVRYHFGSKEELRSAIDDWVLLSFQDPLENIPAGDPLEQLTWINKSFADVMRDQPGFDQYLRRSLLEESENSRNLFNGLLKLMMALIDQAQENGSIPTTADTTWMPYQILFLHLGPLLLKPFVEPHFTEPIYSPEIINQRSQANLNLFMYGLGGEPE